MEALAIIFFIGLVIFFRLVAGSFDADRVERYIKERGWKLLDRSWDPFGPGWFGEKDSRIYQIVYRDEFGNVHRAHVKTSMLSGVYLTNDSIVQVAEQHPQPEQRDMAEENRRLRARIRELEQKLD
jgi:hypothetical protein